MASGAFRNLNGQNTGAARLACAGLALILGLSEAAAADRTYVNPRFGTSITYPDAVFTTAEPAPDNGDGQRWTSPDGAEMAVWGQNNALEETPGSLADSMQSQIEMVTYRKVGASWMVVSGFDGDVIVYHRAEFGRQDVIHSFELRYPAGVRDRYDRLAARIADSLIGP